MAAADCSRHAMESLICAQRVEVHDWRYASARVDVSYLTDGVQVSLTLPPQSRYHGSESWPGDAANTPGLGAT